MRKKRELLKKTGRWEVSQTKTMNALLTGQDLRGWLQSVTHTNTPQIGDIACQVYSSKLSPVDISYTTFDDAGRSSALSIGQVCKSQLQQIPLFREKNNLCAPAYMRKTHTCLTCCALGWGGCEHRSCFWGAPNSRVLFKGAGTYS